MQEEKIDYVLALRVDGMQRKFLGVHDVATNDMPEAQGFGSVDVADRYRSGLNNVWKANSKIMRRRRVVREECSLQNVQ